ncbi:hypothetical protein D3C72_478330 [compost metagenome]
MAALSSASRSESIAGGVITGGSSVAAGPGLIVPRLVDEVGPAEGAGGVTAWP